MAFEVPASKASIGQDQFEFKIGSAKFSVKKMKYIPIERLLELQADNVAGLDFFGAAGTKQGDAVRALEREQFQALTDAWRADSEVTQGESPASSS